MVEIKSKGSNVVGALCAPILQDRGSIPRLAKEKPINHKDMPVIYWAGLLLVRYFLLAIMAFDIIIEKDWPFFIQLIQVAHLEYYCSCYNPE